MKGENILVGDIIPGDAPEHNITPLTKIIDFGRGELIQQKGPRYEDSNTGIVENLWGVGRIMQDLACNMNPRTYDLSKMDLLRAAATKVPTDYAPPGYDNPLETDQAITTMFRRVILDAGEERLEVEDIMEGFGHMLG
ncbi:hypothetical protein DL765_008208 [Monosporascus sp. GIB2]|nr:hypothetical protein DL765_008208 [Monosporascus sp. GIB2]